MIVTPLQAAKGRLTVLPACLTLSFDAPHPSLSTAIWNGGYRLIRHACNEKLTVYCEREKDFPGGSVPAYLRLTLEEQGYPPADSSALLTSADVEKYAHTVKEHHGLVVETVTTGGVSRTAARAGSPPIYEERRGNYFPVGTLNIMVVLNGSLPEGIMARALLSVTEGKTAALQDLGVADVHTGAVATGTATDGVTVVTDSHAPPYTDAGTFSVLGSLLASSAYDTVRHCLLHYDKPHNRSSALITPAPIDPSLWKNTLS